MWHFLLSRVWRLFRGKYQWYILRLFHHTFMVGVAGIIRDADGRILLLRNRFWSRYGWGLPSGYANRGETLAQALVREVREETGYEITDVQLIDVVSGFQTRVEVFFSARISGGERAIDDKEIITAAFFKPEKLPDELLSEHAVIIERVLLAID